MTKIPREIKDVINTTFHASSIDANHHPLAMCYEVVRALIDYGYIDTAEEIASYPSPAFDINAMVAQVLGYRVRK